MRLCVAEVCKTPETHYAVSFCYYMHTTIGYMSIFVIAPNENKYSTKDKRNKSDSLKAVA